MYCTLNNTKHWYEFIIGQHLYLKQINLYIKYSLSYLLFIIFHANTIFQRIIFLFNVIAFFSYVDSSTLAWKIPWTEEPGRLQSMGLLRVRHDWVTSLSLFTFMHWRRKWQPTPVFLPGESQGQGSLVGCHLWGCTGSDMTEVT